MVIDFSIFKNIDLTQKENILFLVIFLVIASIVFLLVIFAVAKIIIVIRHIIRKISIKFFTKDAKRPSFGNKLSTKGFPQTQGARVILEAPKPNRVKDGLLDDEEERIRKQVAPEVSPFKNIRKTQELEKNIEEKHEEDTKKNIEKGFAELQGSAGEESLRGKMPSTSKNYTLGQENYKSDQTSPPSPKHSISSNMGSPSGSQRGSDSSIFGGEEEISRRELEHKMKTDTKLWQAARGEGLEMSPVERANLVKDVFSSELGSNISKSDMRIGIRKLNQKLSNTKDPAEHAKLRREIKFFKKIGGI